MAQADFPHRHAFHEIVYLAGGRGRHVIDLDEHEIRPPQLFVVRPGQVHHWRAASGLRGRLLVFEDDALLGYPHDRALLLATAPALRLRPREARAVGGLFAAMAREYADRPAGFDSVLPALLHVLVVRAHRLGTAPVVDDLAAGFARLLAEDAAGHAAVASVKGHARRLGVSAGQLTAAVKRATGETPGRLIRRAQALEARRLLARTGLTVQQVGRAVGFDDPAYFCRFFRREVGSTPGQYRRKHHSEAVKSIDGRK